MSKGKSIKHDNRSKKPAHKRNDERERSRRYRLREDEIEALEQYRRIREESEKAGMDPSTVPSGWIKSDEASLYFRNPGYKDQYQKRIEEVALQTVEDVRGYAPKYPKIKRTKSKDGHLLIVDPADIHVGKLSSAFETGVEYNEQIAVKRVLEGVQGIIDKSNGFNIDKVLFIAGNDILHTDTPRRTTTSGTPQDTSGMWYDNFNAAKRLYLDVIEMLLQVADVHFMFNPSNHDYQSGFFLSQVIEAHFSKCKNITFDVDISHRKYFTYGTNLIGTTHGDGAKNQDLGSLMSVEARDVWGGADHRYFFTHHVHHKNAKDYINVIVESLRSPSESDSWHYRNGYISPCAIEGFIHSKNNGQVARLTHFF
jgi:hypothetical protein